MLRSVQHKPVTGGEGDLRASRLRAAASRLHRELAAYPAELRDRDIAEEELAALTAMATRGTPEPAPLHRSLLLIAGAIGSVSALSGALREVRAAVDLFSEPPHPGRPDAPGTAAP
ncbi:DUF5955 family protein [Streptomyces sp. NPDC014006]|uniref:DUF5955 family protein n=1 Tax=Streptomyces sp. NPDC014006 TaxID=3364870 RepID=UPI0036FEDF4D